MEVVTTVTATVTIAMKLRRRRPSGRKRMLNQARKRSEK
ncbi:Uncharacterised protein [Serratia marcescens]|nr:Uncharacterised protein [Serratia marcescens]CVD77970.1 Uncharacterised protein [Serratia marcescens]